MFREVKEKIFDRVTRQVLELSEILDQHSERENKPDEAESDKNDKDGENGLESDEIDDEDEHENGNMDTELSSRSEKGVLLVEPLEYDLKFLAEALKANASAKESYGVTRPAVFKLHKRFQSISEGELPEDLARDHSETSFETDTRQDEEKALLRLQVKKVHIS